MSDRTASQETPFPALSAWPVLIGLLAALITVISLAIYEGEAMGWKVLVLLILTIVVAVVSLAGFFVVLPNTARALVLFGRYRGTVSTEGFYWTNPFTFKRQISLRVHNVASETVKVNDLLGNPIEIGAVVVWQVRDTAQALFDVEDYVEYVNVQVETAVRELAKAHPYDEAQEGSDATSLRGDTDGIAKELRTELQNRLDRAGLHVLEARISHLAYAPEIASAMLQRQQATAIIAAREKIVEGAVSMVEQALADLGRREIVELDPERRATLVGNLLVVLCGQSSVQPVLNTGSLYT